MTATRRKHRRVIPVVAALLAITCNAAMAARFVPPAWVVRSERSALARDFGHAKPTRITYIPYPKKIAVVFEFKRRVVCGPCDHLPGRPPLAARMIRVSFDRRTHDMAGAPDGYVIQLCEVIGNKPPTSLCMHH